MGEYHKGGMLTNILVFTILFAFGLTAFCGTPAVGAVCPYNFNLNNLSSISTTDLINFLSTNAAGLVGAAAAIIGTVVFPNPYLIFFGFAVALMGFIPSLTAVFTTSGLPVIISQLFSGLFTVVAGLAVWSWWAGRDVP